MSKNQSGLTRAWTVKDILNKKFDLLKWSDEWFQAFDYPQKTGVWFIWGNSANGKGALMLKLIKGLYTSLEKSEKIVVNDLEEGAEKTVQDAFKRTGMIEVNKKVLWVQEPMSKFSDRLARPKSPFVAIINSWQYTRMNFDEYLELKERHKKKLIIIFSHADGKKPKGKIAEAVMYDAALKIYVEGFQAYSKGRYIGPNGGIFTIYDEGAELYHGINAQKALV